jgi:hypothetical protein
MGGTWYYNRYWFDFGRAMFCVWERHGFTCVGGPKCTIDKKVY